MRIGDHEQFERFKALHHFGHAGDGVATMTHDEHALHGIPLIDVIRFGKRRIEPAGPRNARQFHVLLARAGRTAGLCRHFVETRLQVIVIDFPDTGPMLPCAFDETVIKRQRRDIEADIGRALHVAVAAEDVCAGPVRADVAGREQKIAVGADVGSADGVLRAAHAPDERRRLLFGERLGDLLQLLAGNTADALDFFRCPFGDFGADLIHAVNALGDELLVFPAVVEDVVQHAPDHRNVGTAAESHILGRMRCRAREPRIEHEDVGAVDFLARQNVLKRNWMRFGSIRSHEDDGLRITDIVVGVRHRAIAPGVCNTRDRGRVTDARLVVDRIGAPERRELAEQVAAFVGELRRSKQVDRVGAGLGADLEHLVADLVDGLIPFDLLPLAVDQLHRILQAAIAVHQLAHRRTLCAVRSAIDRTIPGRFLTDPNAVLHFGDDRASDRTMRADVLFDLRRRTDDFRPGLRLAHRSEWHQSDSCASARNEA